MNNMKLSMRLLLIIFLFGISGISLINAAYLSEDPDIISYQNQTENRLCLDGTTLYGIKDNNSVYAVNLPDKSIIFDVNLNTYICSDITVANSKIYVGGSSGVLFEIDAATGTVLNTTDVNEGAIHAIIVDNDDIYLHLNNNIIKKLGEWSFEIPDSHIFAQSTFNIINGKIVVGDNNDKLYIIEDEENYTTFQCNDIIIGQIEIINNSIMFLTETHLYRVNPDGTQVWVNAVSSGVIPGFSVTDDNTKVILSTRDGRLIIKDMSTGIDTYNEVTKNNLGQDNEFISPPFINGNKIYMISSDSNFQVYPLTPRVDNSYDESIALSIQYEDGSEIVTDLEVYCCPAENGGMCFVWEEVAPNPPINLSSDTGFIGDASTERISWEFSDNNYYDYQDGFVLTVVKGDDEFIFDNRTTPEKGNEFFDIDGSLLTSGEGEYRIKIKTVDNLGMEGDYSDEIIIYKDMTPPETTISFSEFYEYNITENTYLISGYIDIYLNAIDPGVQSAGPDDNYYQIVGETGIINYTNGFNVSLNNNEIKEIIYYSDDIVNNVETGKTVKVKGGYNNLLSMKYKANIEADSSDSDYTDNKRDGIPLTAFGVGELTDGNADIDIINDGYLDFIVWNSTDIKNNGYMDLTVDFENPIKIDRLFLEAWSASNEYINRIEIFGSDVDGSYEKIDDVYFDEVTGAGDLYTYKIGGFLLNNQYVKLRIYTIDNNGDGLGLKLHELEAYGENINSTINGTITYSGSQSPVFGSIVTVVQDTSGLTASTYTKADGTYEIEKLPGGTYSIWAQIPGDNQKYSYTGANTLAEGGILTANFEIDPENLFSSKMYKANVIDKDGFRDDKRDNRSITAYSYGELTDGDSDIAEFSDYVGWDYNDTRKSIEGKLEIVINAGVVKQDVDKIVINGVYNNDNDSDDNFIKQVRIFGSDDGITFSSSPIGWAVFGYENIVDQNYSYNIGGITGEYKFYKLEITSESYNDIFCLIHEIGGYTETDPKGGLTGQVAFSHVNPGKNVIITLNSSADNYSITTAADTNGNFQFNNVPAGNYDVYASISVNSSHIKKEGISVLSGDSVNNIDIVIPMENYAIGKKYKVIFDYYHDHPGLGYEYDDRLKQENYNEFGYGELTDGKKRDRDFDDYVAWSKITIDSYGNCDFYIDMEQDVEIKRMVLKGKWEDIPGAERYIEQLIIKGSDDLIAYTELYSTNSAMIYDDILDIDFTYSEDFRYYKISIACHTELDPGMLLSEIEMYQYDSDDVLTASQVKLFAEPGIVFSGGNTVSIIGQVQNVDGIDIKQSGIDIDLTVDDTLKGTIPAGLFTTDTNGQISLDFTSGANTGTATVSGVGLNGSTQIEVINSGTADRLSVTLNPSGDINVNQSVNLDIEIVDNTGTPVTLANEIPVRLNNVSGLGILSETEFTTDGSSAHSVSFQAGDKAGSSTIIASSTILSSDTIAINILPDTTTKYIKLIATPLELKADGKAQAQLMASIEDENGNVINEDITVTFSIESDNQGNITAESTSTGSNGMIFAVYTAGTDFTPAQIKASCSYGDDTITISMLEKELPQFTMLLWKYKSSYGTLDNIGAINAGSGDGFYDPLYNSGIIGEETLGVQAKLLDNLKPLILKNGDVINFSIIASEDLMPGTEKITLLQDGLEIDTIAFNQDGNKYYRHDSDYYELTAGVFSDGIIRMQFEGIDRSYNKNNVYKDFIIDNFMPDAEISLSKDAANPGDNVIITVVPTEKLLSLDKDGMKISVQVDGGASSDITVQYNGNEYTGTYTVPGSGNTVVITADFIDLAGNQGSKQKNLLIDSENSVVSIDPNPDTLIAVNGNDYAENYDYEYIVNASDISGIKSIKIDINNSGTYQDYVSPVQFSNDGQFSIKARVEDNLGNITDFERIIYVDTTPPVHALETDIVLYSDLFASYAKSDVNYTITANEAVNGSGINTNYWKIDNGTLNSSGSEPTFTITAAGTHTIEYWVDDMAGNESEHKVFKVVVDDTAPSISLTNPVSGDSICSIYNFEGTIDNDVIKCSLWYRIKDSTDNFVQIGNDVEINSISDVLVDFNSTQLTDGEYDFKIMAEDKSGNTNESVQIWIKIDNTAPVISSLTVTPSGNGCDIDFDISEDSGVKIEIYNDSDYLVKTIDDGSGGWMPYTAGSVPTISWDGLNDFSTGGNSGLIFWNTLDSAASVQDSKVGPDGSVINNPVFDSAKFSNGLLPPSAGNYAEFPFTGEFPTWQDRGCIELWLKATGDYPPATVRGGGFLFDLVDPSGSPWNLIRGMAAYDGKIYFYIYIQAPSQPLVSLISEDFSWSAGDLVHLAFVWDRDGIDGTDETLRIYQDGIPKASKEHVFPSHLANEDVHNLYIGVCGTGGFGAETDEYLDNIKIWNHAKVDFEDRCSENGLVDCSGNSDLVSQGNYDIKVIARDDAGNEGEAEYQDAAIEGAGTTIDRPEIYNVAHTPVSEFNPINGENLTIGYAVSKDALVTINIYDESGNYIRNLVTGQNVNADVDNEIEWDGKNDSSQIVIEGNYVYTINANNEIDAYEVNKTVTVIIPLVLDIVSISGDIIYQGSPELTTIDYTINKTAEIYISIENAVGTVIWTENIGTLSAGSYSESWNWKDHLDNSVPDGKYKLTIAANSIDESDVKEISINKISTETRIAEILLPENGSINSDIITIKGSAFDYEGSGIDYYQLFINEIPIVSVDGQNKFYNNVANDDLITFDTRQFADLEYEIKLVVKNSGSEPDVEDTVNIIFDNDKKSEAYITRDEDSGAAGNYAYYFKADNTPVQLYDFHGIELEDMGDPDPGNGALDWNPLDNLYGYGKYDPVFNKINSMVIYEDDYDVQKVRVRLRKGLSILNDNDPTTFQFGFESGTHLVKRDGTPWVFGDNTDVDNGIIEEDSVLNDPVDLIYGTEDGFAIYNQDGQDIVTELGFVPIAKRLGDTDGWPNSINYTAGANDVVLIDPELNRIKLVYKEGTGNNNNPDDINTINSGSASGVVRRLANYSIIGVSEYCYSEWTHGTDFTNEPIFRSSINLFTANFNLNGLEIVEYDFTGDNWATSVNVPAGQLYIDVVEGKFKFNDTYHPYGVISSIFNEENISVEDKVLVGPVKHRDEVSGEYSLPEGRTRFYFRTDNLDTHLTDLKGTNLETGSGGTEGLPETWDEDHSRFGYNAYDDVYNKLNSMKIYENGIDITENSIENWDLNNNNDSDYLTYSISANEKNLKMADSANWVLIPANQSPSADNEISEFSILDETGTGFYGSEDGMTVYYNGDDIVKLPIDDIDDYREEVDRNPLNFKVYYPNSDIEVSALMSFTGVTKFAIIFKASYNAPEYIDVYDNDGRKWKNIQKNNGEYQLENSSLRNVNDMVPIAVDLSDSAGWPDINFDQNYKNVLGIDLATGRIKIFKSWVESEINLTADYNWIGFTPVAADLINWEYNIDPGEVAIDVVNGRFAFNVNESRYGDITSDFNEFVFAADMDEIANSAGNGAYTFDPGRAVINLSDTKGNDLEVMCTGGVDDNPLTWNSADSIYGYATDDGMTIYADEDGEAGQINRVDVTLNPFMAQEGQVPAVNPVAANLSDAQGWPDIAVPSGELWIDVVKGRFKFGDVPVWEVSSRYNYIQPQLEIWSYDRRVKITVHHYDMDVDTDVYIIPISAPEEGEDSNFYSIGAYMPAVYEVVAYDSEGNYVSEFNSPVEMVLYYDHFGDELENNIKIYTLNEETGLWEIADRYGPTVIDVTNNSVTINIIHFSKYVAFIDTIAPDVPVITQVNEDAVVCWNAVTNSDLAGYNIYRDNEKINSELVTETVFKDNNVTCGLHEYSVSAVDELGNESAQSALFEVEINNIIQIVSPEEGMNYSKMIKIKADLSLITKNADVVIEYGNDPKEWKTIKEYKNWPKSKTKLIYMWILDDKNDIVLNGEYNLRIRVIYNNRTSEDSRLIWINSEKLIISGPIFEIKTNDNPKPEPEPKPKQKKDNDKLTVVQAETDIDSPIIEIHSPEDGKYYKEDVTVNVEITEDNLDYSYIQLNGGPIENGNIVSEEKEHELKVVAEDKAGNYADESLSFTIDKKKPLINIFKVEDGGIYNSIEPEIKVIDERISSVEIKLNDEVIKSEENIDSDEYNFTMEKINAEGDYTLRVDAIDNAENNESKEIGFKIEDLKLEDQLLFYAGFNISRNADFSIGSSNAIAGGLITTDQSGYEGNAISEESIGVQYSAISNIEQEKGTVMMRIKPDWNKIGPQGRYIFSLKKDNSNSKNNFVIDIIVFQDRGTTVRMQDLEGNIVEFNLIDEKSIEANWYKNDNWTHLALTWNSEEAVLYIGGKKLIKKDLNNWIYPKSTTFWVGNRHKDESRDIEAKIDEFRIYNRDLSIVEIKQVILGK